MASNLPTPEAKFLVYLAHLGKVIDRHAIADLLGIHFAIFEAAIQAALREQNPAQSLTPDNLSRLMWLAGQMGFNPKTEVRQVEIRIDEDALREFGKDDKEGLMKSLHYQAGERLGQDLVDLGILKLVRRESTQQERLEDGWRRIARFRAAVTIVVP